MLVPSQVFIESLGSFTTTTWGSVIQLFGWGSHFLLDAQGLCKIPQRFVDLVGFPSNSYSGHSFRRGGCSLCFEAGLSITDIKLRGDWRSNSFERYIFVPASSVFRGAATLAKCAGKWVCGSGNVLLIFVELIAMSILSEFDAFWLIMLCFDWTYSCLEFVTTNCWLDMKVNGIKN